jgi:parallel beta-helix repeat protein
VQPNTTYCGGRATSQIDLARGDTWVGGEVTGVSTRVQQGAITCRSNCTLVNMDVHDNPRAFAGIDVAKGNAVNVSISGGRVTGSGSLGIGGGDVDGMTIHDVEIDHNGGAANCSFEGGGFKGGDVHHLHFFNNYVHDNNCPGIWLDINSSNNEIDRNRVFNNGHEGILYEISQNASIHDNDIEGNGFHTDGNGCTWLWGGGITIASSFDIQVYGNALKGNCNGITGTQQDRRDSTPPAHLLAGLTVHDNSISGPGETGVAADNGADLATRAIVFANNAASGGASLCGLCG